MQDAIKASRYPVISAFPYDDLRVWIPSSGSCFPSADYAHNIGRYLKHVIPMFTKLQH